MLLKVIIAAFALQMGTIVSTQSANLVSTTQVSTIAHLEEEPCLECLNKIYEDSAVHWDTDPLVMKEEHEGGHLIITSTNEPEVWRVARGGDVIFVDCIGGL